MALPPLPTVANERLMAPTNEAWDHYYVDYANGTDGAGHAGTRADPWKTPDAAINARLIQGGSHDHNGLGAIVNVRNTSVAYGDLAPGTNKSLGSSVSTTQDRGGAIDQPWVIRTDPLDAVNAAQDTTAQAHIHVHLTLNSSLKHVRFERLRIGGPNVTAFDNPQGAACEYVQFAYCSMHHMAQNGPQWLSNSLQVPKHCGTWACSIHHGGNDVSGSPHDHGIYVGSGSIPGADDCFSVNDVIYNITGSGIQMYEKATRMLVCNATIVHTSYPAGIDPRWGIIVAGASPNYSRDCLIVNTLFADIASGPNAFAIGLDQSGVGAANKNAAHHNGFHVDATNMDTDSGDGYPNAIDYLGSDVVADPLFVDLAGRNLRLQAGSLMIGAGDSSYKPPTDFDGNPFVTADIGAFSGAGGGSGGGGGGGGGGSGGSSAGDSLVFGEIDFTNRGTVERTTEGVLSEPVKGHT